MTPKTFDELHKLITELLPESEIAEDYEGQLVIYTNLTVDQSSDNESLISLDAGDIDSDVADQIVQVGLFGKVVYG